MKIKNYQNKEEWLNARLCKITGSRLKDLVVKRGNGKKKGFYELIAERISTIPDGENPLERGNRLETIALARFEQETGKKVDMSLVLWQRDDNEDIAVSPDGVVNMEEACEVKCLSSASHIEAYLTHTIPSEYELQTKQYFIVNDELQTLNVIFYDPRVLVKDYFVLTVHRHEIEEEIAEYLQYQIDTLAEVEEIVKQLTNF